MLIDANISNSRISIQTATPAQIGILLGWAKDELWNPGLDDAALFHATDATGFLLCCVDDKPVAGISLVRHTRDQAFLGLYLCLAPYRGKGLGIGLWNEAFNRIGQPTVGLDGVVDQQANYRKSGFIYHFGNQRFSGELCVSDRAESDEADQYSADITLARASDAAKLIAYDARIGGFQRSAFFRAWLSPSDTRHMLIAVKEGHVVGALGVRQCIEGYKLGPWLANSEAIAYQLILNGSRITGSENVMIDIPGVNSAATRIAQLLALQPVFDTARMYKGDAPSIDTQRLFGVATLELG